jgi:hypothetical protein
MKRYNKTNTLKKISYIFTILFIVILIIFFSVSTLFNFWVSNNSEPINYIIIGIQDNDNKFIKECGEPKITILKNVITEDIIYRCGELGIENQIMTTYNGIETFNPVDTAKQ